MHIRRVYTFSSEFLSEFRGCSKKKRVETAPGKMVKAKKGKKEILTTADGGSSADEM